MPFNYLDASLTVTSINPNQVQMKQDMVNSLQQIVNDEFLNAPDVWTIQEETAFASKVYQDVVIRLVSRVVTNDSGNKIDEDYKKILFQDFTHSTGIGRMYQFNSNYWIVINTDRTKSLIASAIIKRMNNTLRWVDLQGAYHSIPCGIDYLINENRDYSTAGTSLVMPAAQLEIICQFNDETNLIRPNQRFLFGNPGNWYAYKTLGGGINNFNNLNTLDNMSTGLMRLSVGANYDNIDNDDFALGVADFKQMNYQLSIPDASITGQPTATSQLQAIVTMDGNTVSRNITWTTTNALVATVNSTGLVTFVGVGICQIKATIKDNPFVYDVCGVSVVSTPVNNYQIVFTPDENFILQGETKLFNCNLYLNGSLQSDVFTFTMNGNEIPVGSYLFSVVDGNNFSIKNIKKDVNNVLNVTCTSGSNSRVMEVQLRGVY